MKVLSDFYAASLILLQIRKVHSESCYNNQTYSYDDNETQNCNWLRNQDDREELCVKEDVMLNCPVSCAVCCEDDPTYTFQSLKKVKELNCVWLNRKFKKEKYCNLFQNGQMVRNGCPKACSHCIKAVTNVPTQSTIVCGDNANYVYDENINHTCQWVRNKRREDLCLISEVVLNCPFSCGHCCEDDSRYRIVREKGKEKKCRWLNTAEKVSKWCNAFNNGQMVRKGCPKSCNYCPSTVTSMPSILPSSTPPTESVTDMPTDKPTKVPSLLPTKKPTNAPIIPPTKEPTNAPTTIPPTKKPTDAPTIRPTEESTNAPVIPPTKKPVKTKKPVVAPTKKPVGKPTKRPFNPTKSPITRSPTTSPVTSSPTSSPTNSPTTSPTPNPTNSPTSSPTSSPTDSPTTSPTSGPTDSPTTSPTSGPTDSPTSSPTSIPTSSPTDGPTDSPTSTPTLTPLFATEDTYLKNTERDGIFGTDEIIEVKSGYNGDIKFGLVKFDMSPYMSYSVSSATLRMPVNEIGGLTSKTVNVMTVQSHIWNETSVNWTSFYGNPEFVVILVGPSASIAKADEGSYVSFDITAFFHAASGNDVPEISMYFALVGSFGDDAFVKFSSRESSTPPMITIEMNAT